MKESNDNWIEITMAPRADTAAAKPSREVVPHRGELPPAALALARLIGEAVGERLWRETLAAVQGEAVAEDAWQVRNPE